MNGKTPRSHNPERRGSDAHPYEAAVGKRRGSGDGGIQIAPPFAPTLANHGALVLRVRSFKDKPFQVRERKKLDMLKKKHKKKMSESLETIQDAINETDFDPGAGGTAAAEHAKKARRRSNPLAPEEAAAQEAKEQADAFDRLFDHYDFNGSDVLEPEELLKIFADFTPKNERRFCKPTIADVRFVMEQCDCDGDVYSVSRDELKQAIQTWRALEVASRPNHRHDHHKGFGQDVGNCIMAVCVVS